MKQSQLFATAMVFMITLLCTGNLSAQWLQNLTSVYQDNLTKNVGIGTAAPTAKLSVVGSNSPTVELRNTTTDFARLRMANTNNGFWDISGQIGTTDASDQLNFYNNAVGNVLSLSGTGNVGIGTTTPNSKLQVNGNAYVNNDVIVRKILWVGDDATNNGSMDIRFGSNNLGSGEGIGSKRTAGGNRYGLDFYTANTNRMNITVAGNVGIGTTTPTKKLHVNGGLRVESEVSVGGAYTVEVDAPGVLGGRFKIATNGNVGIGNNNPLYKLDVNGTARCQILLQSSDRRFKNDIKTLDGALNKVLAMRGTTYNFNKEQMAKGFPDSKQVGFIAQEMKEIMPELVQADAEGMLAVNYSGVIPVLVEALKEQHEVIEEKETRIAALEAQNSELQSRLARIEAALGIADDRKADDTKAPINAKISPNPSNGLVNVELENTASAKSVVVNMVDASGRQIATRTVAAGTNNVQFDLGQFPAGIYVAQIMADGQMVSSSKIQMVK